MKALSRTLIAAAAALGALTMTACASIDAGHSGVVPAAKIDSGRGELPHYRDWVDPSGRLPTRAMLTASDATR
jgi:hypothetical protein